MLRHQPIGWGPELITIWILPYDPFDKKDNDIPCEKYSGRDLT